MPTIAMIGLTDPHTRMYLDTLAVADEVAAIVLCDEDEVAAGEVAGGGILTWLACHWLDWARYASGREYARVSAEMATLSTEAISVEDTAAVAFRLAGGAVGSLHAGYLLSSGNPGYEGTNTDWAIHLRGSRGTLAYQGGEQGDEPLILESSASGWRNASPRAYHLTTPRERGYGGRAGNDAFRAFLAAGPRDPASELPGALDARRVLELLDAIHKASREGRTVALAPR